MYLTLRAKGRAKTGILYSLRPLIDSKAALIRGHALRARLQRLQAPLRKIGIALTFAGASRKHAIRIRKEANAGAKQTM